ncbi:two-component system, sensor histidine kinase YesM [Butyrivibrio hungatei DSM 14810]|uniref:Two-component system, sensor histidine kinase YesM n=1 Tax=Butyrivibrio hungatei DSM 14810 TaxID=1121132 RepID=A0A1M7RV59_9FIRM|nr:sensor histidine kinase [Butyrivibrio hungatei]SHN50179.1 two-component system, sensor histidine kinase YesM [Butyrivibrio hungatei DSM 14810]
MRKFLWRRVNELNEKKTLSSSLKKVILGIVLSTVAAFMLATYVITKREQIDYGMRDSENVLRTLSSNISSEMEKYMSLSRLIMTEDRLVTFLRASTLSVDIGMINDARYGIMDILNVTEGVDTVMVFREDMIMLATRNFMYIYDYDRMDGNEWKQEIYDGFGSTVVSLDTFGIAARKDSKAVVTVGRAIYDTSSQKRTGILLMNISNNVFERMLVRIRYNNICILGDDGTYIAGNKGYAQYFDDYFLSEKIKYRNIKIGGESQLLSGCQVPNLPIVILRVSPYGMEGIPFRMLYVLLFLLTVFMIIAVYVVLFIRQTITNPIYELSASMENNKKSGELRKIDVEVPYSELEMLEGDYNSMIDHVNELFDELVEKEQTLQRAELRVLQEQIKPHFLYNSIETIGYMAMDSGAEKVHDALETLGSFYRNFLSKGDREIPLSREIWIVKDYLSLQKLRYGDILEDEYHIDEKTQDFVVPKLILQPLVENCIYHGIRMKGEKGKIEITSKLVDGELHLTVKDTGVGMKQEDIDKILCSKREEMDSNDSESFGLWGTIERIRYYAGRDDVVRIASEIGEFTEIEFIIPNKSALASRGE